MQTQKRREYVSIDTHRQTHMGSIKKGSLQTQRAQDAVKFGFKGNKQRKTSKKESVSMTRENDYELQHKGYLNSIPVKHKRGYGSQTLEESHYQDTSGCMLKSKIKNQRQHPLQNNDDHNRINTFSPQTQQIADQSGVMSVNSPRISMGTVYRKSTKFKGKKVDTSLNKAKMTIDSSRTLNDLLVQKPHGIQNQISVGGPKLFIKPSIQNIQTQSAVQPIKSQIEAIHSQYLDSFPILQGHQGESVKNSAQLMEYTSNQGAISKSVKNSQLEMYKSIPIKNSKKQKSSEAQKKSVQQKQKNYSNNKIGGGFIEGMQSMPEIDIPGKCSPNKIKGVKGYPGNFTITPNVRGKINYNTQSISMIGQNATGIQQRSQVQMQHRDMRDEQMVAEGANFSENPSSSKHGRVEINLHGPVAEFTNHYPMTTQSLKQRYGRTQRSEDPSHPNKSIIKKSVKDARQVYPQMSSQLIRQQAVSKPLAYKEHKSKRLLKEGDYSSVPRKGEMTVMNESSRSKKMVSTSLSAIHIASYSQNKNASKSSHRQQKKSFRGIPRGQVGFKSNYQKSKPNDFKSTQRINDDQALMNPLEMKDVYQTNRMKESSRHSQFKTLQYLQQDLCSNIAKKKQQKDLVTKQHQVSLNRNRGGFDNESGQQLFSPISILDSSNQHITNILSAELHRKESGQRIIQSPKSINMALSHEGTLQHRFQSNPHLNEEPDLSKEGRSVNLTDQIRKVNKIQIKKRFKKSLEIQNLMSDARALLEANHKERALQKMLQFLQVNPLDASVHFDIADLYRSILKENKSKQDYLEEAILHFEQVIKLNQRPKGELERGDQKSSCDSEELAAKALFEIVKIRIEQRDFYQANFEIQRANHFQFDRDSSSITGLQFGLYRKFVQSVLLLMKRKVDKGYQLLTEIQTQTAEEDHSRADTMLSYFVCLYKAYASILMQKYDQAIDHHNQSQNYLQNLDIQDLDSFARIADFNYRLAKFLKMPSGQKSAAHKDDKLASLIDLRQQFPLNKEVIRYNAIYLIKQYIYNEMTEYCQAQKSSRKQEILSNVREPKSNPIKKSHSQALLNQTPDKEDMGKEPQVSTNKNIFYLKSVTCNIDYPSKQKVIKDALEIVQRGLAFSPKDRNLLLTRSHIFYYQHSFYESLCDIEAVIEIERASSGEEEPNATDLLHRGRCHACLSMFKEAIMDFTKVIELDEELFDAYLFRGKCSYLIGDTSQAFLDFQKLIMLQPKNPMVHAFAGNLLMTTGSYDDATKAFTNADKVHPCAFAIYQRARCHLALGEIKNAMNDLYDCCDMYEAQSNKQYNEEEGIHSHPNPIVLRDKLCLEMLLNCINFLDSESAVVQAEGMTQPSLDHSKEELDSRLSECDQAPLKQEMKQMIILPNSTLVRSDFRHNFLFLKERFDQLIDVCDIELREIQGHIFTNPQSINDKAIQEAERAFSSISHDSRMQQQIIPNVNRIKIEKVRALYRAQEKHKVMEAAAQKKKKADLTTFSIENQETDKELKEKGLEICPWSYYMENLFSLDDLFLYRGILRFYGGFYLEAIQDFLKSQKVKTLQKQLDNQQTEATFSDDEEYDPEQDEYNIFEFGDSSDEDNLKAVQSIDSDHTDLSDIGLCSLNSNERMFNILLCLVKLGRYKRAYSLIKKLLKSCPSKYKSSIVKLKHLLKVKIMGKINKENGPILIEPFVVSCRLCRLFPYVEFNLSSDDQEMPTFVSRPSFSLPFVKPPNMIPNVDESLLFNEFGTQRDETNLPKPQALWIKIQEVQDQEDLHLRQAKPCTKNEVLQYFQFTDTIIQPSQSIASHTNSLEASSHLPTNEERKTTGKSILHFDIDQLEIEVKKAEEHTQELLKAKELSTNHSMVLKKSYSYHQR